MRELITVIWMACKDLIHDKRMSLCLVLTVASIALPLLLFFGLKSGVVEVMRQRMINDPSFMEVIPQGTSTFDAAWFSQISQNPHVGFVVPKTRELGVGGTFRKIQNDSSKNISIKADMQPTGSGDWLLQSYAMVIPAEDSCVITTPLAQKLDVKKNDYIEASISRQKKGGGFENAKRKLLISDILPMQASGRDMVFIPLIQLERMEAFRDGFGVSAYNWPGEKPLAYPIFYDVLLYTKQALDPVITARIRQRAGFIQINDASAYAKNGWYANLLKSGSQAINLFKLQELRNILRGKESVIVPIGGRVDTPLQLSLSANQGQSDNDLQLKLASTALWASSSWQHLRPNNEKWSSKLWDDIQHSPAALLVSENTAKKFSTNQVWAHVQSDPSNNSGKSNGENLSFKVQLIVNASIADNLAYAAPGLISRLNLLSIRPLNAVQNNQEINLLLGRQNYSRFRMYAKSLDDVAPLAVLLEKEGIIVKTKMSDIERVKQMDYYLSFILSLIAGAAVLGGAICLLASLYASVERKRKALAVLRLLGIHGPSLCAFPLTAGLVMTGLGMLLSLIAFHIISYYMNFLAQDFILPGEVLCRLDFENQLFAIMWALIAAIISGLAAALRLLKIEAAESLRDE